MEEEEEEKGKEKEKEGGGFPHPPPSFVLGRSSPMTRRFIFFFWTSWTDPRIRELLRAGTAAFLGNPSVSYLPKVPGCLGVVHIEGDNVPI